MSTVSIAVPKLGMEPIRRSALVNAAIDEIGKVGSLDVTVAQIARRAGVSSALAHHYFGSKEQILLAAMRHILLVFGSEVRGGLAMAKTPDTRLEAIVRACFSPTNFRKDSISAWLNFYVLAQRSEEAKRLLSLYHRRLQSNLVHALNQKSVRDPHQIAERIGGLIDGLYLRSAINHQKIDGKVATAHILEALKREMAA